MLQDAAGPEGHGHLVVGDAHPLALEVLGVIDADAGGEADEGASVGEVAIVEDGQHAVGPALGPGFEEGGHGHFREVELMELELPVEDVGHGEVGIREVDAQGLDLTGDEGLDAVVG